MYTEATISLSQAALGGTVRVQGVYEDQTIQVLLLTVTSIYLKTV